jgi:maltose/maltodextrin transport system substrate-binding protein
MDQVADFFYRFFLGFTVKMSFNQLMQLMSLGNIISLFSLLAPGLSTTWAAELTLWMRADKSHQRMAQLGQEFQENTGIAVRVETPEAAIDKFIRAAQIGKGPDLFWWAHDRTGDLVASGLLQALELSPSQRQQFDEKALQAFTIQGTLYGYPIGMEAVTLVYNRRWVTEVPPSFEALANLKESLAIQGIQLLSFDYSNFYFTFPFLAAQEAAIFPVNSLRWSQQVKLNAPGSVAGLAWLTNAQKQGVLLRDASYSVMIAQMIQQKLAFMITGPWEWSHLTQNQVDYGVAPLPTLGGHPARAFVGVQGFMINRSSPHPELAQEFMENYVLTERGLQILNGDVPIGVPAVKAYAQTLSQDPRIAATQKSVETGILIPNHPEMNAVWTHMAGVTGDVINDRISAQDALDQVVKKIRKDP